MEYYNSDFGARYPRLRHVSRTAQIVFPFKNGWAIFIGKSKKPACIFREQTVAIAAAKEAATRYNDDVIVFNPLTEKTQFLLG